MLTFWVYAFISVIFNICYGICLQVTEKSITQQTGLQQYWPRILYQPFTTPSEAIVYTLERNAPFLSNVKKEANQNIYTPGPGSYQYQSQFAKKISELPPSFQQQSQIMSSLQPSQIAFTTTADRFKQGKPISNAHIGPGTYEIPESIIKKGSQPKQQWQPMNVIRRADPPSIPSHNQVFGYEETPEGEVVPQQNPDKIYAGEKGDTIGPGHYDSSLATSKKGTEWAKYKSKRVEAKSLDKAAVGPGAYNPPSQPFLPMYKKNKNSVFASQVPKAGGDTLTNAQGPLRSNEDSDIEEEEDDPSAQAPGPGHYYNPKTQTAFKTKEVPVDRQYFGSTVDRFQKKPIATQELNIGPGFYGDFSANYHIKKGKAPFLSKKQRFNCLNDENPGPGLYKAKGLKETVKEKTWGRQGVFGSTEKRFAPSNINEKIPGPGTYQPLESVKKLEDMKNVNIKKSSSMFISKSKRDPKKISQDIKPPVGEYNPANYTLNYEVKKKAKKATMNALLANIKNKKGFDIVPFDSKEPRFVEKKKGAAYAVGPGAYPIKSEFDIEAIDTKPNMMPIKADRFKNELKPIPGPGTYNKEEGDVWNKRTYNILFAS